MHHECVAVAQQESGCCCRLHGAVRVWDVVWGEGDECGDAGGDGDVLCGFGGVCGDEYAEYVTGLVGVAIGSWNGLDAKECCSMPLHHGVEDSQKEVIF